MWQTLLELLIKHQKVAYLITSMCFVLFLYGYIYYLYYAQKRGIRDYEKYANLALQDNLYDEVIEPRNANETNINKGEL